MLQLEIEILFQFLQPPPRPPQGSLIQNVKCIDLCLIMTTDELQH